MKTITRDNLFGFFRYLISGGSTYVLYVSALYVGIYILKMNETAAFLLSFAIANIFNYLAHYFFTFSSKKKHGTALKSFVAVITFGALLGMLVTNVFKIFWPDYVFVGGVSYGVFWPLISYFLLKKKVFANKLG
ncbi:MAG: hypothetical protein COA45_12135 [Zetaproteobacteria bacterium]|nr:MAG: hypothetical protein COA45_12135 [Zetaproteobacteria bacterium]